MQLKLRYKKKKELLKILSIVYSTNLLNLT